MEILLDNVCQASKTFFTESTLFKERWSTKSSKGFLMLSQTSVTIVS